VEVTVRSPLAVLAVLAFVLLSGGPASAAPPREVTQQLTDDSVVLGADGRATIREAVDELAADSGIELYTVIVSTFDSVPPDEWVAQTADLSGLEGSDVLFAVAVGQETYEYSWWVDEAFPLLEVDVENAIGTEVEPALETGDWAGAVSTLAGRLGSLAGADGSAETPEAADAAPAAEGRAWSATTTVLVVGGLAVVLLVAHLLSRRRTSATS
jgi:uncharacterized membrane protein YgcG